jgi:putative two-component system response regulator
MKKILIVDDQESKRKALAEILSEEFQILEAVNGMEASKILERLAGNIALVLLDFAMPVMDGLELLHLMEQTGWIKMIPVIMIASESSMDEVDFAYEQGAVDYINWPLDRRAVRYRVKNAIMAYEKKNELSNMIVDQLYEREKDMRIMIEILSNLMAFRNGESGLHVLHMHTITEMLLRELQKLAPRYGITETDIILISNAITSAGRGKDFKRYPILEG